MELTILHFSSNDILRTTHFIIIILKFLYHRMKQFA